MIRIVENRLDQWLSDKDRKPLVLRGARQVGKTWLVRNLAKRTNKRLVEFNFEREFTLICAPYWRLLALDSLELALKRFFFNLII